MTRKELTGIFICFALLFFAAYAFAMPVPDTGYFPNTAASWYWSITTYAGYTNYAWGVVFSYGYVHFYHGYTGDDGHSNKSYAGCVRTVRGGQYWPLDHSVIFVSPASRAVAKDAGTTTFSVSNTGVGTMPWAATVN